MAIAERHASCYLAFYELRTAVNGSKEQPSLLDEFDKYRLWAGNVGAAHIGKTYRLSLDYRLRESSFYKEQVLKLLDILNYQTRKAAQILRGERVPFERISVESDSDNDTSSEQQHGTDDASMEDDSPWEISSDSDEAGEELKSSLPARLKQPPLLENMKEQHPPHESELGQLLASVKLSVACLYKLPLRRPAPMDRLNDKTAEEVSHYLPYDLAHVRNKFPDERVVAEVTLRLAKMITRRRQLLVYREKHKNNLQTDTDFTKLGKLLPKPAADDNLTKTKSGMGPINAVAQSANQPLGSIKSKATTMKLEPLQSMSFENLLAPSVAFSDSKTSLAASEATQDLTVEVPRRPKGINGIAGARFECRYCYLTPDIRSDRGWKKHVLNDLQPYLCTFPNCNMPDCLFESRDDWYNHEVQHHRFEFFCNIPSHQVYPDVREFELHMKSEHDMALDTSSTLLDIFRRPPQSMGGLCNLCFRHSNNLKIHVSRHLQQVALFAIPRVGYARDDDKSGINSDVALDTDGDTNSFKESELDQNSEEKRSDNEGVEDLMPPQDLYSYYGLSKDATAQQILQALNKQVHEVHPGIYGTMLTLAQFHEDALEILLDKEKRVWYDAEIRFAELQAEEWRLRHDRFFGTSERLQREEVELWSQEGVAVYMESLGMGRGFPDVVEEKKITGRILWRIDTLDQFVYHFSNVEDNCVMMWTWFQRVRRRFATDGKRSAAFDPYQSDENDNVPDIAEDAWDLVTDKFSQAREGHSDPPPKVFANDPIVGPFDGEVDFDPDYFRKAKTRGENARIDLEVKTLLAEREAAYAEEPISQAEFFAPAELREDFEWKYRPPWTIDPNADAKIYPSNRAPLPKSRLYHSRSDFLENAEEVFLTLTRPSSVGSPAVSLCGSRPSSPPIEVPEDWTGGEATVNPQDGERSVTWGEEETFHYDVSPPSEY